MKKLYRSLQADGKYRCIDQDGTWYSGTPVEKKGLSWSGLLCLDLYQTFGLSGAERIGEVHIDALGNVVWAENTEWAELEVKSA